MNEPVRQLVHDLIQAWNAHDSKAVQAFYAPDFAETDVAQAETPSGPDGVGSAMAYYLRAFPDLRIVLDELIVDGNRAAMFWTWHGTHQGMFMRIPPTGRAVSVRGTSLLTIENGQIRRVMRVWDLAGLLRSIG